jgi:hypothetical protein
MLNGEPVDCICNNCLSQQMSQIDIFDSKDLDNNITHNSTIIAHVINVPEEKENIFEFPNLKGMHFIHVNARSILPKMSELRIMAKESKAAVIAISETWLDSSVINSEIQIEGYSILRNDRDRHGGGVCTYIINSNAFNTRTDLQTDGVDSLWIEQRQNQ